MKKYLNLLSIIESKISENEKHNSMHDGSKAFPEFKKEDFIYIFEYVDSFGKDIDVINFISFCYKRVWLDISKLTFENKLCNYNFVEFNYFI